jgi:hypothetical protein
MVGVNTKEIYSEVYSILDLLGDKYIKRLPKNLYNLIKNEKLNTYNPKYDITIPLYKQNIKKDSLSMIALFHLNYWCESDEDKEELREIFGKNEKCYQEEIREKYNPDNIFKKKEQSKENDVAMIEYKESIITKIINRIKKFFNIKNG